MLDTFVGRPCLILALERENAVSCFHQILEGYVRDRSLVSERAR